MHKRHASHFLTHQIVVHKLPAHLRFLIQLSYKWTPLTISKIYLPLFCFLFFIFTITFSNFAMNQSWPSYHHSVIVDAPGVFQLALKTLSTATQWIANNRLLINMVIWWSLTSCTSPNSVTTPLPSSKAIWQSAIYTIKDFPTECIWVYQLHQMHSKSVLPLPRCQLSSLPSGPLSSAWGAVYWKVCTWTILRALSAASFAAQHCPHLVISFLPNETSSVFPTSTSGLSSWDGSFDVHYVQAVCMCFM